MSDPLVNTYLMASVGVGLEVAFTALSDFRTVGRRLTGQSYLWMFPIYALSYPLLAVAWPVLEDVPWPLRGLIYVVAFFVVEYASGWLIRRLVGECPWEAGYHTARWGIHGLVRLDYAPAWFVVALLFERLYLYLT